MEWFQNPVWFLTKLYQMNVGLAFMLVTKKQQLVIFVTYYEKIPCLDLLCGFIVLLLKTPSMGETYQPLNPTVECPHQRCPFQPTRGGNGRPRSCRWQLQGLWMCLHQNHQSGLRLRLDLRQLRAEPQSVVFSRETYDVSVIIVVTRYLVVYTWRGPIYSI